MSSTRQNFARLNNTRTVDPTDPASRRLRVLLVDAVTWAPAYPAHDPRRNVRQWYARWLTDSPDLQLDCVSAEADLQAAVREGVDGLILSGSPRDAWAEDPVNTALCELVHTCRDRQIPFLGICYGHQLLARALGGRVARHPQGLELGNTPVCLTPAGRASPLFAGLPETFEVLSSHVDAVWELPPGAELTVRGVFTECQGFQCGPRLCGVQFHPETDPETLRFLWSVRRETWRSRVHFDLDRVLDGLEPTPMASRILSNFIHSISR